MKRLTHKWRRYLILLPPIYLVASAFIYNDMSQRIDDALFTQKYNAVVHEVDMLTAAVDKSVEINGDWGEYEYSPPIVAAIAYVDDLYNVFACCYQTASDGSLVLRSEHIKDLNGFDPCVYPEFFDAIAQNEDGGLVLNAAVKGDSEIRLYYRWMPTGVGPEARYLAVVAVSLDSIVVPLSYEVTRAQIYNIAITVAMLLAMTAVIMRGGSKNAG